MKRSLGAFPWILTIVFNLTATHAQEASIHNGLSYLRSTQSLNGSWGGGASEEKGTGYFSGVFRGRPQGVRLDTSPSSFAIIVCQSGEPKGPWLLTAVRMRESS